MAVINTDKEWSLADFKGRSNNLQLIRFFAAVMVIFNHSFPLSNGDMNKEWIYVLTNKQATFGSLAVDVFFLCSGFFAIKSISKRKRTFISTLFERYIRLAKPLFIVVVICIILGGFISSNTLAEYYTDKKTYRYFFNVFLLLQHDLPGVFLNNIFDSTVNGSLWTLPLEYLCFVACAIGEKAKLFEKKIFIYTIPMVAIVVYIIQKLGVSEVIIPSLFFYIGIVFYIFRENIIFNTYILVICICGLLVSVPLGIMKIGVLLFMPYILFYIWFNKKQVSANISNVGNNSYEMYLWAWPVQQLLVHMNGGKMNSYSNFFMSVIIVVALSKTTNWILEISSKHDSI